MATVNTTTNTLDYSVELTAIIAQLTRIADALEGGGSSGISPAFTRAMTINSLKNGNQLKKVVDEMNNPTPLPGGA